MRWIEKLWIRFANKMVYIFGHDADDYIVLEYYKNKWLGRHPENDKHGYEWRVIE